MSESRTAIPSKAESTDRNERQYQVGVVKRYGLFFAMVILTLVAILLQNLVAGPCCQAYW